MSGFHLQIKKFWLISSETEVDGIDAGESIVVDTSDSILGDAEIVSITY